MIKLEIIDNRTTAESDEVEHGKIVTILNKAFTYSVGGDVLLISNGDYWLFIRNGLDVDTFEVFDNMSDLACDLLERGYDSTDIRIIEEDNIQISIQVELD